MTLADWPWVAGYFACGGVFALATRGARFSLVERIAAWPYYALAYLIAGLQALFRPR